MLCDKKVAWNEQFEGNFCDTNDETDSCDFDENLQLYL